MNILVQSSWSTNFDVGNIVGKKDSPNIENYKVLSIDDFSEDSRKIIQEGSIVEDSEKLWNVDEVYFLNYEKTEMILRSGKEVFFLEGKDFSNPEIIRIVKDKLELN